MYSCLRVKADTYTCASVFCSVQYTELDPVWEDYSIIRSGQFFTFPWQSQFQLSNCMRSPIGSIWPENRDKRSKLGALTAQATEPFLTRNQVIFGPMCLRYMGVKLILGKRPGHILTQPISVYMPLHRNWAYFVYNDPNTEGSSAIKTFSGLAAWKGESIRTALVTDTARW